MLAPIKLCGLLLLCLTTAVMAFNLFGKKTQDKRMAKRQFFNGDTFGNEYIMGEVETDTTEQPQEEVVHRKKEYKKHGRGKLYTDNRRIATEYTTVTGSCIQAEGGQHYYTQYNNIQRYFQMGIYGRSPSNRAIAAVNQPFSTPFSLQQTPTCVTDPEWDTIRNHWNAIFFGDYKVGGYQQTLGPLAVRGDFRANDYVLATNRNFQCSDDVRLGNTAFVVGGSVAGSVVISRGMSYVGNLANSVRVSGTCQNAKQGPGPVDWNAYYTYWTNLSEAYSQLMPTHYIDNNKVMNTVNPGTTNPVNVFTFNTCNSFNCPLWPGLLSTPDNIFSGYDTWDGPVGRYPSSGTLLFNIPVDDGTTFNIDSIHPSINADYCRTIYNVYPADAEGNYLPTGHITIRRNTVDMIRGLFLAPLADIQDGPTGRFGGMVVGDNYSWQQRNGVEIDDWAAAANGAYYCSRYTGCMIGPTPTSPEPIIPTVEPTDVPEEPTLTDQTLLPTPTECPDCPDCPGPETFTDCQTTVSQCTATSCVATETLVPPPVTVTENGDCDLMTPDTITQLETRTDFVVSTQSDCTATETHNQVGPTVTVTLATNIPGPTHTETILVSTCSTPDPDCTLTDEFCLDTVTQIEPAFCTDYATITTSITCTDILTDPFPGECTGTETHCYPGPTRTDVHPVTVTHTHTQTVTYVPGCDDYRYPQCDPDDEDGDGGGDGGGGGGGGDLDGGDDGNGGGDDGNGGGDDGNGGGDDGNGGGDDGNGGGDDGSGGGDDGNGGGDDGNGGGDDGNGGGDDGNGGGDDGDDGNGGGDDGEYDYFKRKKHGKKNHHKKNHWNKKKKMDY